MRHNVKPPYGDGAGEVGDDLPARRRAAFQAVLNRLIQDKKINSLYHWCQLAGVRWSTVGPYVQPEGKAKPSLMSDRTYAKLARALNMTVTALKGEAGSRELTPLQEEFLDLLDELPPCAREIEIQVMRVRVDAMRAARSPEMERPKCESEDWRTVPSPPGTATR
jgi:hypothetical protein